MNDASPACNCSRRFSILPIGKETFKLGSNDAGITFQNDDPEMMAEVDKLGAALNLKQHSAHS